MVHISKMVSEPQEPSPLCQGRVSGRRVEPQLRETLRFRLSIKHHPGAEDGQSDACSTLCGAWKFLLNMCSLLFKPHNDFFFSFSSG